MKPDSIIVDSREFNLRQATDAQLNAAMRTLYNQATRQQMLLFERTAREVNRIQEEYDATAQQIMDEMARRQGGQGNS
jgi:hypothetical protein